MVQIYCKFPSNAYIYLKKSPVLCPSPINIVKKHSNKSSKLYKKSSIVFEKTAEDLFIFYGEKLINVLFSLFHFLVSSTHEDHDVVYQCSQ